MTYDQNQQALDEMEVDPMQEDEADQAMDNGHQMMYERPPTLEQSISRDIDGINSTRRRAINELHEWVAEAEAYSNQELIWDLQQQLDWWTNVG